MVWVGLGWVRLGYEYPRKFTLFVHENLPFMRSLTPTCASACRTILDVWACVCRTRKYISTQRLAMLKEITSCHADSSSVSHSVNGSLCSFAYGSLAHSFTVLSNKPTNRRQICLFLWYLSTV